MVGLRAASSPLNTSGGEPSKSSNRQNDVELELTTASSHSTFSSGSNSSNSSSGGGGGSSSRSSPLPGGVSTLKVMRVSGCTPSCLTKHHTCSSAEGCCCRHFQEHDTYRSNKCVESNAVAYDVLPARCNVPCADIKCAGDRGQQLSRIEKD